MLVLELMDGDFAFSSLAMLSWGLVYGAIAFAYTLSAGIIVLFLGKYRKELILALPLAFFIVICRFVCFNNGCWAVLSGKFTTNHHGGIHGFNSFCICYMAGYLGGMSPLFVGR